MGFPYIIEKESRDTIMMGLTTIYIYRKKNKVKITHHGNMGNSMDSVRENVDLALGKEAFNILQRSCKSKKEDGSPDYSYTLTMRF